MIVAFSTSSKQASVALISPGGEVLWCDREEAPQAASGACMRMLQTGLQETSLSLADATVFAADLGPGSFTGVRVGVTLAKTLAFTQGAQTAGADAFDLIDPERTVVLPNKRGEWFVRRPGLIPERVTALPEEDFVGFGPGIETQVYPDACRFAPIVGRLARTAPESLVPVYLVDPSISTPKRPYGVGVAN